MPGDVLSLRNQGNRTSFLDHFLEDKTKNDDTIPEKQRGFDCMGFPTGWDGLAVLQLMKNLTWTECTVLSRKNVAGSFSWRIRGPAPSSQRFQVSWCYEIEDRPTWILIVLLAPPKLKNLKLLGFRVPENRFVVKLILNNNYWTSSWKGGRPHFWELFSP